MPPEFVVFLDENHCRSPHILRPLAASSIRVESFKQHFTPGTLDQDRLPTVGRNGWILLTTDKRIRYRHLEKRAVEQNKLRMFCFTSNFKPALMEIALTHAIPRMRTLVQRQPAPWVTTISEAGLLNLLDTFGHPKVPGKP